MKRFLMLSAAFALVLSLQAFADDEKKPEEPKPAKTPEPKAADWSAFADHTDIIGIVFKADDSTVTIRTTTRGSKLNGYKEMHNDVDYKYAEAGLARSEKEPVFMDDKGAKRPAKASELEKLRKPIGAPGYAMERSDLKEGDIVKLKMVRPASISKTKAKPEDLLIKYAIKTGEKAVAPPPKK